MKRRIVTLALTLCLLLGLASAAEPSQAATVYFTAVNDTLLELSDATMPFWSGGLLYVPASAFGSGGLGITDSYNAAKKTLTLKRSGYRLVCNLTSGMTADSNGKLYEFVTLEKNGIPFVPINEVCRIFDLFCTTRSVPNGYLVRIRNDGASYTDEAFLSAASAMIASRYQDYMASHRQEESTPDGEDTAGRSLYLALTVRSAADAHGWLTACSGTPHHATFFLTEEFWDDPACNDALRRILAEGHGLGLAVGGSDADEILETLRAGNARLFDAACTKTRLVLAEEDAAERLKDAGYCPVSFDRSCAGETNLDSAGISQLLSRAGSAEKLDLGDALSETSLKSLLRSAYSAGFTGRSYRETAF